MRCTTDHAAANFMIEALRYNIFELAYMLLLSCAYWWSDRPMLNAVLWVGAAAAALYVLVAASNLAREEMKVLVLEGEVTLWDLWTGALCYEVLAIITFNESWQIPILFIVAGLMHIWYHARSEDWLDDQERLKNAEGTDKRMPPV